MMEAMNQSVDPCDDFYDFACGRWSAKNIMPSSQASYGTIRKLVNVVDLKVKGKCRSRRGFIISIGMGCCSPSSFIQSESVTEIPISNVAAVSIASNSRIHLPPTIKLMMNIFNNNYLTDNSSKCTPNCGRNKTMI